MKLTSIVPWYGSKRSLADEIVARFRRHRFYVEAPCGGLAVLLRKPPSEHETVCDLHGALTNLAWVLQDQRDAEHLYDRLQRTLYSDRLHARSLKWLAEHEPRLLVGGRPSVELAYHYFVAAWIGRNGVSGTARTNYQLAVRWTKGGGSGPTRFRAAVDSIPWWHDRLRRVLVLRRDLFDVLGKVEDDPETVIYCDPPYLPTAGAHRYLHDFAERDHARLAGALGRFRRAQVLVSYVAHPRLAAWYRGWRRVRLSSHKGMLNCNRHRRLHEPNRRGVQRVEAEELLFINRGGDS